MTAPFGSKLLTADEGDGLGKRCAARSWGTHQKILVYWWIHSFVGRFIIVGNYISEGDDGLFSESRECGIICMKLFSLREKDRG